MYFKYDLKIGFRKNIMSLIFVIAIVVIAGIAFRFQIFDEKSIGLELPRDLNSMDYFLHIFEGARPFHEVSDKKFQLPIAWFLINMILFYFTGKYPYSEIYNNHGANVLMKGGSRNKWFISKWFWSVLGVISYYLLAYISVLIFCLGAKIPISFDIKPIEYQNLLSPVFVCTWIDTTQVFISPIISSVAAVSVQLVVSLITSSFMGFLFMAVLYISSAYYFTPFLIGNLSMLARNSIFNVAGISLTQVIIISAMTIILSLVAGIWIFRRQDIMERK